MVSEDYGKGCLSEQVSCGQCEKNFRHVKRVKASYGNRERLRSRVISAVKWVRSSSLIAINFKPRRSGRTFRTMASVRICLGTSGIFGFWNHATSRQTVQSPVNSRTQAAKLIQRFFSGGFFIPR